MLEALEGSKCVALRYLDPEDEPTERYPFNPNGSQGVSVFKDVGMCWEPLTLLFIPSFSS